MLEVSVKDYYDLNILNVLVKHNEYRFNNLINDLDKYSKLGKTKLINIVGKYKLDDITVEECYKEIIRRKYED